MKQKNRPVLAVILCFLTLGLPATILAHGGAAPLLLGDPDALPPGSAILRDPAGRLIFASFDANRDGRTDVWNFYEKGKLVRQESDQDFDGTVDFKLYLEQGQPARSTVDRNGDGIVDLQEHYHAGRVVGQSEDTNGDGRFDTCHIVEADVHICTQTDTDHDGRTDRWTFFDVQGDVKLVLVDENGDGIPELQPPATTGVESDEPADIDSLAEKGDVLGDEVVVSAQRCLTAASDRQVRDRDFVSLPRRNPSDLVRLIPGVHVSQHTGGAKAYQYFLRGFDAEHGQDLAAFLDGIPLNEPSQVHGHGYLDLHFLIPETIGAIRIIKGPYDPQYGNFATAGAIDFIPRRVANNNSASATAGMFGTARVLGSVGLQADPYLLVGAVEIDHSDGYTDPGGTDALRANTGHTFLWGNWALGLMTNHYGQDSTATDVIPQAWVEEGKLDRFASLDPSDRVVSNRHLVGATADFERGPQSLRLQGYFDNKRTSIWSNYTFYLLNPERGDQQEMRDQRDVLGANIRYRHALSWGPTIWDTALGIQWRYDRVDQVLANATARRRWNVINDLRFIENAGGLWIRETATLARWLTLVPGMRLDLIGYRGRGTHDERFFNIITNLPDVNQNVARDWDETASIASPKASVILTPLAPWDLFINYGEGFFSNTTLQMADEPKNTIPKVRGGELGTRLGLLDGLITLAAAAWWADKEQDLVFDPQTGLASTKQATRRTGLDGELRIRPLDWLCLMTDASYVDARFVDSGDRIPNGPIVLMTNGVGWSGPVGLRGQVRGRFMGRRELDQDDFAPPYYVVDLVAGYDTDAWGLELAVDNLLDTDWEDAVFSYETRPEKNKETYSGIHWTPGTPLFARFSVTAKF